MSSRLENAWTDVLANISGPEAIPALVRVLDRTEWLDDLKAQVLREAAAELRADGEAPRELPAPATNPAAAWLRDALNNGERRVQELKDDADQAGIGWRTVERAKREAGAVAMKHDRAWWWSLATSPRPPVAGEGGDTLSL